MIPISDNIRCWNKPIITYWLIGINIAVFLWELQLEFSETLGYFVNSWGVIPAQISAAITNALFFNSAAWIIVIWRVCSLIFGIFLHGSFSQILGNMLFLWVFGKTVENILGRRCYLGFYLASGIITEVLQILAEPSLTVPLIGANGAIAAILGAYVMKFPKAKIDSILPLIIVYLPIELPAFFYIFWWFVQQLFYGIGSLNISPVGVNQSGVIFWGQVLGLGIGAAFMRLKR
ncbi:rhomboid family intramembrane serine protease [Nostoc sp. 'Peltigera membranacea cyanobiont' 213]|uniref:rhomboid family intramembrane serine protease n=1 Tax=Nostoc sp. 'Peltigera membranacea cyanobiont' 213 TaxID=2014530 RepID=UPI000B95B61E|nr:rhomboid family intramembrane serine protease [Nostoc sp. 'Peltigera membranacea cyanobiont' 213]OYD88342.1 rhomboid family intramembrane serine protease [Nostoc sp. 'Peltigera membranacea cyanobiont' 213]